MPENAKQLALWLLDKQHHLDTFALYYDDKFQRWG